MPVGNECVDIIVDNECRLPYKDRVQSAPVTCFISCCQFVGNFFFLSALGMALNYFFLCTDFHLRRALINTSNKKPTNCMINVFWGVSKT